MDEKSVVDGVDGVDGVVAGGAAVGKKATAKEPVTEPTAVELLYLAAEKLEGRRGMRAKTCRLAAGEVREIAARLEALE